PVADPFGAPAANFGESAINDPLATGGMLFSGEGEIPPAPDLSVPDDLPMLTASVEMAPPQGLESVDGPPEPAPPPRAAKGAAPGKGAPAGKPGASGKAPLKTSGGKQPARPAKAEAKVDEEGYGLVVSGLALKSKKEAAIAIICELRGITREEAYDLCRS